MAEPLSPQTTVPPFLFAASFACESTSAATSLAAAWPRFKSCSRGSNRICYCFILKCSRKQRRWHQHPSCTPQLVWWHGKWYGCFTAPPPQPQPKPDAIEQVSVHHISILLPQTRENATSIGHEEKVKDPQGRRGSQGRVWGNTVLWLSSQCSTHRKNELRAGNAVCTCYIKELFCKIQKPPWDERQDLKPLLPSQLHLHCVPTDSSPDFTQQCAIARGSVIFISSYSSAAQNFLLLSFSLPPSHR